MMTLVGNLCAISMRTVHHPTQQHASCTHQMSDVGAPHCHLHVVSSCRRNDSCDGEAAEKHG